MARQTTKRAAYKNPKAPEMGKGEKRAFLVAAGANIFGENIHGEVTKIRGDALDADDRTIMLTETGATFYANLGYIEVTMDFNSDKDAEIEALRKEIARLASSSGTAASAVSGADTSGADVTPQLDGDEAADGDSADASGGVSGDGPRGGPDDEDAKPARPSRRRSL